MGRNRDRLICTPVGDCKILTMCMPPEHHDVRRRHEWLAELRRGDDPWPGGWLVRSRAGGPLFELTQGAAPGSWVAVAVPQGKAVAALEAM